MVRTLRTALIPLLALSLSACVSVDHGNKGSGSGGSGGSSAGGASSGGSGNSGPAPTNTVPAADTFDAHVTGRFGDDITLSASGTDAEGDVLFLSASFENDSGDPVAVFDTHWDGMPDSNEDRLLFDTSLLGKTRFDGTVTLAGFATRFPDATHLTLHLEDAAGHLSPDKSLSIGQQVEKKQGESCDPDIVASRCERGLACTGTKATCQPGTTPALVNALYMRASDGPRLLATGGDDADNIAALRLQFFDNSGAPVKIDLDGDQIPDADTWDLDAYGASDHGTFFLKDQLGLGFETVSPKMKITPIDDSGNTGSTKSIAISAPFEQADKHSCDPRGFDTCSAQSLCAPGIVGATNACTPTTTVRQTVCSAAPVLDPTTSVTTAYGRAAGVSMWDPPAGCTQADFIDRPEGLVKIHLPNDVHHLTVSTAVPETRSDTVIYLIADSAPDCGSPVTTKTPCNDDTQGYSSTLTVADVPAGDYLVVVDSVSEDGGSYGLTISTD
ncbi:MAG TPA: hypothetical protein VHC69_08500 [Polyangiaceae bacterium]|nr:hypothetical protein [Polyangiaceae bacterium]